MFAQNVGADSGVRQPTYEPPRACGNVCRKTWAGHSKEYQLLNQNKRGVFDSFVPKIDCSCKKS